MNTELQLIVRHIDGKSVCTLLVITMSRGHTYKHSGIREALLSCVLLLQQQQHRQNF